MVLIDFNELQEIAVEGMNGGKGEVISRMQMFEGCRTILCRIPPGSSIGSHEQKGSNDVNFVVSGNGVAICDGKEERLHPGTCQICPNGKIHSIINDGDTDLVLFTFVQKLVTE